MDSDKEIDMTVHMWYPCILQILDHNSNSIKSSHE